MIERRDMIGLMLAGASLPLATSASAQSIGAARSATMMRLIREFFLALGSRDYEGLLHKFPSGYAGGKGSFGYEFSNRFGIVDYLRKITDGGQKYNISGEIRILSDYFGCVLCDVEQAVESEVVDSAAIGDAEGYNWWLGRPWLFAFSFVHDDERSMIERLYVIEGV